MEEWIFMGGLLKVGHTLVPVEFFASCYGYQEKWQLLLQTYPVMLSLKQGTVLPYTVSQNQLFFLSVTPVFLNFCHGYVNSNNLLSVTNMSCVAGMYSLCSLHHLPLNNAHISQAYEIKAHIWLPFLCHGLVLLASSVVSLRRAEVTFREVPSMSHPYP